MAKKTIKKYVDLNGLKRYHNRVQKDLADRDYQSESEVKASIQYYHKHDAADAFVAKEEGKGLSSNDFTNEFKKKLDGLENVTPDGLTEEQVAKIRDSITQKDLDDGQYQTLDDVNEIINATKQEIFGKGYQTEDNVRALLATSQHLQRKLVTSSDDIDPTAPDAEKYIYLVPLYTDDNTVYSEWVVVDGQAVMVGTGFTNLDDYWMKGELTPMTDEELLAILI